MIDLKKLIEERDKREKGGEMINEDFLNPILSEIASEIHKQSEGKRNFADLMNTFSYGYYEWTSVTRSDIEVYMPINSKATDDVCKLITKHAPIYVFFYMDGVPTAFIYPDMVHPSLVFFNPKAEKDPKIQSIKKGVYTFYSSYMHNGQYDLESRKGLKEWLREDAHIMFDKMVVINMEGKNSYEIRSERIRAKQNYIPSSTKEREKYYKELLENNIAKYKIRIKELRSLRDDWYDSVKNEIEDLLSQYGGLVTKIHTDIRKYAGCQYKFDILTDNMFKTFAYNSYEEKGLMAFVEEYTENKMKAVDRKSYIPSDFDKLQESLREKIQKKIEKCKTLLKEIEEEANSAHK